jgi:polyferredoxin
MDVLRLPLLGQYLRWRYARTTLQVLLLILTAAVVLHGLMGPQIAPRNLATVLTSIHWRGLLIVAILAAGNLFCTACPMMLVRDAGRRVYHPALRWPRWLRGKWLAIVLLGLVLFVYELFDLWSLPRATAWFVIGYFALALVIDVVFAGASFCKYLCPIGQFNFIASSMSPTELQVRDLSTCRTCRTADCIKGRYHASEARSETKRGSASLVAVSSARASRGGAEPRRLERRGCELGLFLPLKVGNLDCTMCLDCVQACPHDNIALATRLPGAEWLDPRRRSGIGRLAQRRDLAALAVVFTFAALLNAFAMTAPSALVERRLAAMMGVHSEAPALLVLFVIGLVVAPIVLVGGAGLVMRLLAASARSVRDTVTRYAFPLVPIGVGVWLAHYGFHLLTGIATALPVMQSAAIDLSGRALFGEPAWGWVGMQPGSVFPLQLGVVLLGAAGSAGLVHATSLRDHPGVVGRASAPWLALVALLTTTALWILSQPMEMRAVGVLG